MSRESPHILHFVLADSLTRTAPPWTSCGVRRMRKVKRLKMRQSGAHTKKSLHLDCVIVMVRTRARLCYLLPCLFFAFTSPPLSRNTASQPSKYGAESGAKGRRLRHGEDNRHHHRTLTLISHRGRETGARAHTHIHTQQTHTHTHIPMRSRPPNNTIPRSYQHDPYLTQPISICPHSSPNLYPRTMPFPSCHHAQD
jgi:hypothetical protein